MVILTGMLVTCVVVTASPQVLLEPLSQGPSVSPPGLVTGVFRITNTGTASDIFELQATVPQGWTTVSLTSSASLEPGTSETVLLALMVPVGVLADEYEVVLRAVSSSDPSIWDEASLTVEVEPRMAVELFSPRAVGQVLPGELAEYWMEVVNRGNVSSEFELEARSNWLVEVTPEFVGLSPGERTEVLIRHWAPKDVHPGTECYLTVAVHSVLEADVTDKARIRTTVLPPLPQAVGGSLMEEVPTHLRFSINRDVFSRKVSSNIAFSLADRAENGWFSVRLGASSLFGPDPVEIDSFSVCYRRTPTTYVIGNTKKRLTGLLSLSCYGGSVTIDAEHYDLIFLAGVLDDETRVGGRFLVGPEVANAGIAYVECKGESDRRAMGSLTASVKPLDNWSLQMEGALGVKNMRNSRAIVFTTKANISGYSLSAEAFSVGTYFPGDRSDQAGMSLSQSLRHEGIALATSLSHSWNNVIKDPLVPTTVSDDLKLSFSCPFSEWMDLDSTLKCTWEQTDALSPTRAFDGLLKVDLSLSPFEEWPTIDSSAELGWERSEGPTMTNKSDPILSLEVTGSRGIFPYSFSIEVSDQIDHVADTHYRTLSSSEKIGLSIETFDLFLELTHTKLLDCIAGETLSGGTEVSLSFQPQGSPHSAKITLSNMQDAFGLSFVLGVRILEGVNVQFNGASHWHRSDTVPATFTGNVSMNFSFAFDLPIPFIVTKGRIEGRVFDDINANGQYDQDEKGIPDLLLALADTQALTGEDGQFRFSPLPPGDYSLRIVNLPFPYVPLASMPIPVHLETGVVEWVEVPVVEGATITGQIALFREEPSDGFHLEGTKIGAAEEPSGQGVGIANVLVKLSCSEETRLQISDPDGFFQFDRLPPGHWTLEVTTDQLPRYHYLDQGVFEFDLQPGEHVEQVIKVFERHRPIQFIGEGELQLELGGEDTP